MRFGTVSGRAGSGYLPLVEPNRRLAWKLAIESRVMDGGPDSRNGIVIADLVDVASKHRLNHGKLESRLVPEFAPLATA